MPLIDSLRSVLGRQDARSYQLMGEDLALLPGASLRAAAAAYEAELACLAPPLRARFEVEQMSLLREAHRWLSRYIRSLNGRVAGYMALGRRCDFRYPWPVVAVLGICQVMHGITRNRLYGLAAPFAGRLGLRALDLLTDRTDDVLRRTNRGIFADSIPTALLGLRAHELHETGDEELAEALLCGPLPPILDEESRALARGLSAGLAIADERTRFRALADLTLRHFGREQSIFSHHLGAMPPGPPSAPANPGVVAALFRRLVAVRSVSAPVIAHDQNGRRLLFREFPLPRGFDLRDHDARVEVFGSAFVTSVTSDSEDYRTAADYVRTRFAVEDAQRSQ